jgi:predicted membrane protein
VADAMVLAENESRPRRRLALGIWAIAVLMIWGVGWLAYAGVVEISTCLLGDAHGGRVHSEGWAGGIGLLLLVLAVRFAFRGRRRLLLLGVSFLLAYVAGLVLLWEVSPVLWGPTACTGGSF